MGSAAAYTCADRKLAARGSMLDVAVREPKGKDRRCRDSRRLHSHGPRSVFPSFLALHVRSRDGAFSDPHHLPQRALASQRVPDHQKRASSEVVLVVPVRIWITTARAAMSHLSARSPRICPARSVAKPRAPVFRFD
jgi:hypothetical protein